MAETKTVNLSSADRVLFPEDGVTKGELFEYYRAISGWIVPHLRDRPFTMKRWREGIAAPSFFQKQAPKGMPSWIPTRQFLTHPREGGARLVDFPLVNDEAALLWMVQMHCIDMNAWYSRVDKPHRPDFVLFDLDPPDDGFELAIEVAHLIRDLLDEVGLPGYVKTSGADGIHVVAPITRRSTFPQTYAFAEQASRLLEVRHPGTITTEWLKKKRDASAAPRPRPATEPTSASRAASIRMPRATRRSLAPRARRVPISRIRWKTVMLNAFRIRNAPTNSAMPEKK